VVPGRTQDAELEVAPLKGGLQTTINLHISSVSFYQGYKIKRLARFSTPKIQTQNTPTKVDMDEEKTPPFGPGPRPDPAQEL